MGIMDMSNLNHTARAAKGIKTTNELLEENNMLLGMVLAELQHANQLTRWKIEQGKV